MLQALKLAYQKDLIADGPMPASIRANGDAVEVTFDHVGGGLVAKDKDLKGFAIAGADGVFHWADASIDGSRIVCRSSAVEQPVELRYNWASNPIGALFNEDGLPAGPFKWKK